GRDWGLRALDSRGHAVFTERGHRQDDAQGAEGRGVSRDHVPAVAARSRGGGMLRIAGVEREVTLELKTRRNESTLTVRGETQLLMTDYGVTPPKAML